MLLLNITVLSIVNYFIRFKMQLTWMKIKSRIKSKILNYIYIYEKFENSSFVLHWIIIWLSYKLIKSSNVDLIRWNFHRNLFEKVWCWGWTKMNGNNFEIELFEQKPLAEAFIKVSNFEAFNAHYKKNFSQYYHIIIIQGILKR